MGFQKIIYLSALVLIILNDSFVLSYRVSDYYNNYTHDSTVQHNLDTSPSGSDSDVPYSPEMMHQRKSKLFPLFTIIRFTNEACVTTSEELGVCYTRSQCSKTAGVVAGSCAQGLGVCCQHTATCGATITQNGTFFRNPDYPSKYSPTGSDFCQVRVRKQLNICQLRINFIAFDVSAPSGPVATGGGGTATTSDAGTCKTDAFTVTSSGEIVPTVCGIMTGQHMYLNYGSSDTITLSMMLGSTTRDREWNIQTQMIPCRSALLAPTGCLQYFQGVSGTVRSFNFPGGIHLANQDYSSCVRMEDGMRSIEWTACNTAEVKISGSPATGGLVTTACPNLFDYLIIPGGVSYPLGATAATATTCANGNSNAVSCMDRFCDVHFLAGTNSIRSLVRPFLIHLKTDSTEINQAAGTSLTDASVGFCLEYQQSPQT